MNANMIQNYLNKSNLNIIGIFLLFNLVVWGQESTSTINVEGKDFN